MKNPTLHGNNGGSILPFPTLKQDVPESSYIDQLIDEWESWNLDSFEDAVLDLPSAEAVDLLEDNQMIVTKTEMLTGIEMKLQDISEMTRKLSFYLDEIKSLSRLR